MNVCTISPNPDLRGMPAEGSEFGSGPFAVYVYNRQTCREYVARNHSRESATAMARREADDQHRVHVSLDTCG